MLSASLIQLSLSFWYFISSLIIFQLFNDLNWKTIEIIRNRWIKLLINARKKKKTSTTLEKIKKRWRRKEIVETLPWKNPEVIAIGQTFNWTHAAIYASRTIAFTIAAVNYRKSVALFNTPWCVAGTVMEDEIYPVPGPMHQGTKVQGRSDGLSRPATPSIGTMEHNNKAADLEEKKKDHRERPLMCAVS